ncbi:MAG: polysaccharide deacetylase family protein [Candidatus Omnitrophota bacterium]
MELSSFSGKNRILFTSSWDDGSRFDLKLADLLARYGVKATFYISIANKESKDILSPEEIRHLDNTFEIGAHTYSHNVLTRIPLDKARQDIEKGKRLLEDLLGKRVGSFCFPRGKFNEALLKAVLESGFDFARTTGYMRTKEIADLDKGLLYTTLQVYDRPLRTCLLTSVERMDGESLANITKNAGGMTDFTRCASGLLRDLKNNGGSFHLWGHSWEIEKFGLWSKLEDFLKFVKSTDNIVYCTNSELWESINDRTIQG